MRCQEVQALVMPYSKGEVDEYTKIRIHHHLAGCKNCTEAYEIWSLGEKYINQAGNDTAFPVNQFSSSTKSSSSMVMSSVMSRIQQEEKWANPSVKRSSYSTKMKTIFSFGASMLLILFVLVFAATTLIPDNEVVSLNSTTGIQNEFTNLIMISERVHYSEETSMEFQVLASISDPIVYVIPSESSPIPYGVIFSIFGILCIILGMSWFTRV